MAAIIVVRSAPKMMSTLRMGVISYSRSSWLPLSSPSSPTSRAILPQFQPRSMIAGVSSSSYYRPSSSLSVMMNLDVPTTTKTPRRILLISSSTSSRSSSSSSTTSDAKPKEATTANHESASSSESSSSSSSHEIVLTPGEKVVATTRLFFWAGAVTFASVCAYYIGKELLPTKMSPNTVFDKATAVVRQNEEVKRRFGDSFKTYGRDHGGHREGRRNFIEHTEYTDPDDGSQRTRVRFNLEGAYGSAFVFAEVSKDMPSGEFVYILVQDKRNGAVITVQDNRSALLAKRLAGGSQEGQDVFSRLLGGGAGKQ